MDNDKQKDIIDRHSKRRAILIEDEILFNPNIGQYIHEIIDINEISDYYDTIILTDDIFYMKRYLEHWMLNSEICKKFDMTEEMRRKYKFILLICSKNHAKYLRKYYQCETLTR